MPATWATTDQVEVTTGITVSDVALIQAEQQIELVTGAVAELTVGLISQRDAYWLQQAVAYQAAWIAGQPDLYTRNDVSSAGQDGQSATFKPDGLTLAPLARRAVKRLSWRGTRTITPVAGVAVLAGTMADDDKLPWRPL